MSKDDDSMLTLWDKSENRCPHVRHNGYACECKIVHPTEARAVCDIVSVQLWCLSEEHVCCSFFIRHEMEKTGRRPLPLLAS
jgi:hypothetical protein